MDWTLQLQHSRELQLSFQTPLKCNFLRLNNYFILKYYLNCARVFAISRKSFTNSKECIDLRKMYRIAWADWRIKFQTISTPVLIWYYVRCKIQVYFHFPPHLLLWLIQIHTHFYSDENIHLCYIDSFVSQKPICLSVIKQTSSHRTLSAHWITFCQLTMAKSVISRQIIALRFTSPLNI